MDHFCWSFDILTQILFFFFNKKKAMLQFEVLAQKVAIAHV